MVQKDEITRIMVGGNPVGIQGLNHVIGEISAEYREQRDFEIIEELLYRLSEKNYIPKAAKEKYGRAVLKEFYRYIGKPWEQDTETGDIKIIVLGPGCQQCDMLEQELMEVMNETGIAAEMEHVRDIKEIGKYGVMGTPALIINGEVKSVGSVPPRPKLITWLKEALPIK